MAEAVATFVAEQHRIHDLDGPVLHNNDIFCREEIRSETFEFFVKRLHEVLFDYPLSTQTAIQDVADILIAEVEHLLCGGVWFAEFAIAASPFCDFGVYADGRVLVNEMRFESGCAEVVDFFLEDVDQLEQLLYVLQLLLVLFVALIFVLMLLEGCGIESFEDVFLGGVAVFGEEGEVALGLLEVVVGEGAGGGWL